MHQTAEEISGGTYPSVLALAADLHVSLSTVRLALQRGQIPHRRVGSRYVISRAAIKAWLTETKPNKPTARSKRAA